jgi:ribosomal protein S3
MAQTLYQAGGVACVALLLLIMKFLLGGGKKFSDFITGDDGRYSLSRLQAVLWAVFIISHQFSVALMLLSPYKLWAFDLVFTQNITWLLGLSLGSYVLVKGITVNRTQTTGIPIIRFAPKPADLVTGDNGLDFSRFQMLIWTILGLAVYIAKCNSYDWCLLYRPAEISQLFKPENLPDISGTFVVLMGLSQGAYIGKKLVPTYQVNQVRENSLQTLQGQATQLELDNKYAEQTLNTIKPHTVMGKKEKERKKTDLELKKNQSMNLESQIAELHKSIRI